jgi:4a-hydroxytetrahydrobiopterin dehydratase
MAKLSEDEINAGLDRLDGWIRDGQSIRRQYVFDGFASAMAFMVRIGFDAEAADHHPDILLSNYKKVTLTFSTHSEGGVTEKDLRAAAAADQVFGRTAK